MIDVRMTHLIDKDYLVPGTEPRTAAAVGGGADLTSSPQSVNGGADVLTYTASDAAATLLSASFSSSVLSRQMAAVCRHSAE